jgi:PD-(D/E)XK nuclease superfamily
MANDEFRTAVQNSSGHWPDLPFTWSYSSLREVEDCPRRWMLSRATYPGIWPRPGYPPRPSLAAMLGEAVHRVVEVIIGALHSHGCTSLADPAAVVAMRKLGGYSKIAELAIQGQVSRLEVNPRAKGRTADLEAGLLAKLPQIRQSAQDLISRTAFQPVATAVRAATRGEPTPLVRGSYPELDLRARALRLAGRADLITITDEGCEITDYKTGLPDPHHADQIRMYALLWSGDTELNPRSLPVRQLTIAYSSGDTRVTPPTQVELDQLASDLAERVGKAEAWLRQRPPPARPAIPMCRLCGVRQLCDEYWALLGHLTSQGRTPGEPDIFDYEGIVVGRDGPRSWRVAADKAAQPPLIVRISAATPDLRAGDRVRILNLLREHEPDMPAVVGVITVSSEIFLLEALD